MKTITVTTQNAINYGAVLQAYALQQVLIGLGVEDRLLNLARGTFPYYFKPKFDRTLPSVMYNNLVRAIRKSDMRTKIRRFNAFTANYLMQTKCYSTIREVLDDPPQAHVYITGGDQMFNSSSVRRPTNLLAFGDPNVKRISYSTSLGTNWFENSDAASIFKRALSAYDAISLRESGSKAPLEALLQRPVSVHVDPTLLLDKTHWANLITQEINQKYILCYSLLNNTKLNDLILSEKKRLGLPVWVINPNPRCYVKHADKVIYDAGPIEFLNLISGADEVISTSFHGVCFSVIFEKPFLCLVKIGGDLRYESLLCLLKLQDRIMNSDVNALPAEISYDRIREILHTEREKSLKYLKGALSL